MEKNILLIYGVQSKWEEDMVLPITIQHTRTAIPNKAHFISVLEGRVGHEILMLSLLTHPLMEELESWTELCFCFPWELNNVMCLSSSQFSFFFFFSHNPTCTATPSISDPQHLRTDKWSTGTEGEGIHFSKWPLYQFHSLRMVSLAASTLQNAHSLYPHLPLPSPVSLAVVSSSSTSSFFFSTHFSFMHWFTWTIAPHIVPFLWVNCIRIWGELFSFSRSLPFAAYYVVRIRMLVMGKCIEWSLNW